MEKKSHVAYLYLELMYSTMLVERPLSHHAIDEQI